MNQKRNGLPQGYDANRAHNHRPGQQPHQTGLMQPKTATASQMKRPPVAPPVRSPQASPKTAQPKQAATGAPALVQRGASGGVLQGKFPDGLSTVIQRCRQTGAIQPKMQGSALQLPSGLSRLPTTGGRPLPANVLQKMEAVFGTGFSDVRVHVGPQVGALGALALTQGSNIYFGTGQYNPNTAHGHNLLAHELTHVVQQRSGRVKNPFGGGLVVVQDRMLEAEADRMGHRASTMPAPLQAKPQSLISSRTHPAELAARPERIRPTIQAARKHAMPATATGVPPSVQMKMAAVSRVVQCKDVDLSTMAHDPGARSAKEKEKAQEDMYTNLGKAKDEALGIALAYAKAEGAGDAIKANGELIGLNAFEITQRNQTGFGRIPVEWVYEKVQGQAIEGGNDNRRRWKITIDIDDPPYAAGGQRPHVGYTVEVIKIGAQSKAVNRDIGHVWLDAVPAGRPPLHGGLNIWN
jgi:Domain of unknown function (DUF4157)